jgi:hypothetical protein
VAGDRPVGHVAQDHADYDYWLRDPLPAHTRVLAHYRMHPGQETFSSMDENKAAEPVRGSRACSSACRPPTCCL